MTHFLTSIRSLKISIFAKRLLLLLPMAGLISVSSPVFADHNSNAVAIAQTPAIASNHVAHHRTSGVLFDLADLDGVDTILIASSTVPDHDLLPIHEPSAKEMKTHPPSPLVAAVTDIFAAYPWITVKDATAVPVHEWSKPNVIVLDFAVSARRDTSGSQPVTTGALALQLWKYDTNGLRSAIPVIPATYPFIIPTAEDGFNKTLATGVRFLTSYLPSYFVCANRDGPPTNECPECRPNACKPGLPFGETSHAKCGGFINGHFVPCWQE